MTRASRPGPAPGPEAFSRAPAKLNLTLAVTGRRGDGYHTLRSVFVRLALHDVLEVWTGEQDGVADGLEVVGDPATPVEGNLVLRAATVLREALEARTTLEPGTATEWHGAGEPRAAGRRRAAGAGSLAPLSFRLTKHIPVAAGLAGGSSDGVAALDLAARAWGVRLEPRSRLELALRLGADGPFFATGRPAALIGGIGEQVEPLPAARPRVGVLLVTPRERLATAHVFAELDRMRAGVATRAPDEVPPGAPGWRASTRAAEEVAASKCREGEAATRPSASSSAESLVLAALRAGPDGSGIVSLAPALRDANDLWPPAARLSPTLARQRAILEELLERPVLLSGSGPTLFALYPSAGEAADAGERLRQASPDALEGAVISATRTSDEGDSP